MVCEGKSVKFEFIAEMDGENDRKPREGRFPVTFMCEMLEVSPKGYYAWKKRAPSARQREDVTLTTLIVAIHDAHKGRYGIDRIHADLARNGYQVSPKRVRRLARAAGLRCVHPRPYKVTTVQDPANAAGLVDLVGRDFVPPGRNELWYGDITYIFTMSGWAYLATVIDGYSRKVVGWSVADNMREEMVIDALAMAARNRNPGIGDVVFHSDRGSQYTGRAFRDACLFQRHHTIGRENRHLFRQRSCGIMECDVQEGAHPPARLEGPRACTACRLRIHRGVLQPYADTESARLSVTLRI